MHARPWMAWHYKVQFNHAAKIKWPKLYNIKFIPHHFNNVKFEHVSLSDIEFEITLLNPKKTTTQ